MNALRPLLHSLLLALVNIGAIIMAFGLYKLLKPPNQMAFQAPIAALLSISTFTLWIYLIACFHFEKMQIQNRNELVCIYFLTLIWMPVILIPLHYSTQGYWTSFSNILAVWIFQIPVNFITLLTSYLWIHFLENSQNLLKNKSI
jgi:hypothetical protein